LSVFFHFRENRKITNYDLHLARQELELLKMLRVDVMLRSMEDVIFRVPDLRPLLLGELLFSDRTTSPLVVERIKQISRANDYRISLKQINDVYRRPLADNVYWFLLKKEAELAGIRIPSKYAGTYYSREVMPELMPDATYSQVVGTMVNRYGIPEERILSTFGRLLAVLEYARMICLAESVTTRQLMHNISWAGETIDVEFVRFGSSVFAEDQNEPTEEEILGQFEKCRRFFPADVSDENPYGFGYKLADRVRLEYIAVRLDDVSEIVPAPTHEEAEEYYQKNRDRFTEPVPSDPNDPNSPLTRRIKSYAEVSSDIVDRITLDKINSKAEMILHEAKTITEAGLEEVDTEPADLSAEQFKQKVGDYESAAEQLSGKHEIKVYAGQTGLLSAADIRTEEHLGRLYMRAHGYGAVGLAQIAFSIDEIGVSELGPFDVPKPKMYENIGPLKDVRGRMTADVSGQVMAIVRVIEAKEASEPESIEETFSKRAFSLGQTDEQAADNVYSVREKVVEDLKKLAAMGTAKVKAEEFRELAVEDGWESAIDEFDRLYGEAEANEVDPNADGTLGPNTAEPNTVETSDANSGVKGPFRLESLTNMRRVSSMGLDTLVVQSEGNLDVPYSIDMFKKESRLRDHLYSLVPPDSNTVDTVPLVREFKPDMSYYCLKKISVRRIYRGEYEQAKAMQGYREDFVQAQSITPVHFNPDNIVDRMNFRWVKQESQTADANAPSGSGGTW
jgi:hypothetical protein